MRLLPVLCCLVASAYCFSIDGLKGKELWKTVSNMSPEDIDEVARIIAENSEKVGDRMRKEHAAIYEQNRLAIDKAKEYVQELKKSIRPIPGGLPPSITEINMRSGLEEVLIEGDMIMTPEQARNYFGVDAEGRRSKRQAYQPKGFPDSLWKDGVYYTFDPAMNQKARDVIHAAATFWQANTCIKFTETADVASSPVKPVIVVSPGVGCNSMIGRNMYGAESQVLNLEPGKCEYFEVATHEMAHALGFMHEQSRWDRDNYLTIDLSKVKPNMTHNYNKYKQSENDNYGKPYDYGGNMHYEDNFFAANENDTVMIAKNPAYQMSIGGSVGPVFGDVYEMNMLYSCYEKCKTSGTVCKNEGKPNPNKCNECQCPSGFEGKDCSQRQASSHGLTCGDTLEAGADWTPVTSTRTVGAGNTDSSTGNETDPYQCTWHITAPAGKVIEYRVKFVGIKNQEEDKLCRKVCRFGGLKIKGLEKSWIPEGMRFCCKKQSNQIMTTASNLLVVQAYNSFYYTDFEFEYKLKDGPVTNSSSSSSTSSTTTTTTTTTTAAPTNTSSTTSSTTTSSSTSPATNSTTSSTTTTTAKPVKVQHFGKYTLVMTRMTFNESEAYCATEGRRLAVFHKKSLENTIGRVFNLVDKDAAGNFWIGMKKAAGKDSPFEWVDGSPIDYENWPTRKPRPTAKEQCVLHWHPNWSATNCAFKYASVCQAP